MASIFISSTTEDLQRHRAATVNALRIAGHEPVLIEDVPTGGVLRPIGSSLAAIERSDALIGIVAWHYGLIPLEENPKGRSFVELEVQHALRIDKPTFVFLASDEAEWPPSFVDSGEPRRRLEMFREAIRQQSWVQLFTTIDDLSRLVTKTALMLSHTLSQPGQRSTNPSSLSSGDVTQAATVAPPALPSTIDPFELAWRLVVDRQAEHSLLLHMDMTQLLDGVRKVSEGHFEQPATAEEVLRTLRAKQTNLQPDPLWLAWMRATSPLVSTSTPTPPPHAA